MKAGNKFDDQQIKSLYHLSFNFERCSQSSYRSSASFDQLTTEQIQDLSGEEIKEFSVYLKEKGLTIEEIAKHLHRGETEIE